jgi:hypothetical protein
LLNPDFAEMLRALCAEDVDYLLVGAYAMAAHGVPRATGDLDVWVRPTPQNAQRVLRALRRFGAPLLDLTAADLARAGTVFQIGLAPRRIDIMTSIDGVSFEEAWPGRVRCRLGGDDVVVLGRDDLVRNKRAAKRPKDLVDLQLLGEGGARRRRPAKKPGRPRTRRR